MLVERVEGFAAEAAWKRAYREINEFESQLVDSGATVVKFWLQLSKEEQLRRFEQREHTDYKKWKLTAEDWRNREKWDLYEAAVEDMLLQDQHRRRAVDGGGGELQVVRPREVPARRPWKRSAARSTTSPPTTPTDVTGQAPPKALAHRHVYWNAWGSVWPSITSPRATRAPPLRNLVRGMRDGEQHQVLLGVTGSGKTFTMAKVIENCGRPALILAHNKTLAAQLYHEFKSFLPGQRGRVLRQLLRLLPAGGLYPGERRLHREGSHHQRRAR